MAVSNDEAQAQVATSQLSSAGVCSVRYGDTELSF